MNGPTTELWPSTMSAPRRASTNKIGRSQNFFRTRRNAHTSATKPSISSSELPPQRFRRDHTGVSRRPVGPGGRSALQSQRIGTEKSTDDRDRRQHREEDQAEEDR